MKESITDTQSTKQMNAIEEMAHVGSWFWDLRTNTRTWSNEFYRICGLALNDKQLNAETAMSFIHPEDKVAALEAVQVAIENKQPYKYNKRLIRQDGSVRYISANGKATYDDHGKPVTMYGTIHDITNLRETELLLQAEKETLSQYLNAAASIFLIINSDHTIQLVNEKGCEVFGYSPDQIIGKNWFQNCIPKNEKKNLALFFDQIIKGTIEAPDVYENWVVVKGGKRKLIRWRNAPLKDKDGIITGLISSGVDVTEHIIAEQKLRDSEEKNWAILNALPDVMTIHDDQGKVVEINMPEESYRLAPKVEFEGKTVHELLPEEVQEKLKTIFAKVPLAQHMETIEITTPVANGTIDYECRFVPLSKNRVLTIARNISESKETQNTLHLRNRALEAAGNGIIIADAQHPDLPIIYSNKAFSRMTGYRQSEILGKNCRMLQNNDRDQDAIVTMAKAIQKGEACHVVLRNYRKDGAMFWNELNITPLYDEDQNLTHFIGVQSDVTEIHNTKEQLQLYADKLETKVVERTKEIEATNQKLVQTNLDLEDQIQVTKLAENKAHKSQAQFIAIAKNFPKGLIVVFDTDFRFVYVEGMELKRMNLKKNDFEGKRIEDIHIFSKKQRERIKEDILKTIKGKSLSFEIDFQDNYYAVNSTPLHSDGDDVVWALFVYNNITEQKNVQEELAKALKIEQELNELKSRFISMASHEFRTPLSAILSSAILIGKQNEPGKEERREKHVARIRTHVKQLVVILNDFLSLSKLEEGKVQAKPQYFELIEFCKKLVDEMDANKKQGQSIRLKYTAMGIPVALDPKLLRHILTNLLSNALKYSDEGQQVVLELIKAEEAVIFKITDTGIGISKQAQQHLFERFYRADNATNIQGTGIGLHIVKQYAQLMHGAVSFTSKIGKGSTFTVQLPLNLYADEKGIIN